MINTREMTGDGVERNFATNTLGTYLLTTGLLPHMKKYESPQVITVTSGTFIFIHVGKCVKMRTILSSATFINVVLFFISHFIIIFIIFKSN